MRTPIVLSLICVAAFQTACATKPTLEQRKAAYKAWWDKGKFCRHPDTGEHYVCPKHSIPAWMADLPNPKPGRQSFDLFRVDGSYAGSIDLPRGTQTQLIRDGLDRPIFSLEPSP